MFTARTVLVSALLLTACPPDVKESASDTEPSSGDTTEATTGVMTTGTTTEATTEAATEATTTGATETGSTETSGGMEWPACVPPDVELTEGFEFDLSTWAPEYQPDFEFGAYLAVDAACQVTSMTPQDPMTTAIVLSCTEGSKVDLAVPLVVTIPPDLALPFAADDAVRLRYSGHGEDVDLFPGDQFALLDEAGTRVLLAGFDDPLPVGSWNKILAPLVAGTADGLCPCEGACDGESGTEREAFHLSDGMGHEVTVLDRQRGTLEIPGSPYEVVVRAAIDELCFNCQGDHRAMVVALP